MTTTSITKIRTMRKEAEAENLHFCEICLNITLGRNPIYVHEEDLTLQACDKCYQKLMEDKV